MIDTERKNDIDKTVDMLSKMDEKSLVIIKSVATCLVAKQELDKQTKDDDEV